MIKQYLQIIKPGIVFGNTVSVIGGFLLAAKGQVDYILFFSTLIGVSLIVSSGCVLNNYIDRDIDRKMKRTRNRIMAKGLISLKASLIYSSTLGISGLMLLHLMANPLATWLAMIGFIIYVGVYSLYMKRKSIYSTPVGSLSGAMPPLIGYCAVSNRFDTGALILMFIFSLWQMAHFYAIAIFHFKDYQVALIPILPVKRGILVTKHHIICYIVGFIVATLLLTLSGYSGYKCFIVTALISILWLGIALQGYRLIRDHKFWARKLFIYSIIVITLLNVMISVDFSTPTTTSNNSSAFHLS